MDDEGVSDLVGWLDAGEDRSLSDVLTRLLGWMRRHHAATERVVRDGGYGLRNALLASASAVVPREASADVDAAVCGQLAMWLRAEAADSPARLPAAVRNLAAQFDTARHASVLVARESSAGPALRGAGALVPRLSPHRALKAMYGAGLGTNPASLASSIDLQFFALLPDAMPYGLRVRLHGGWDGLDELAAATRLGCALPWCFTDVVVTHRTTERFFGCAPAPADHAERTLATTREVLGDGARVVLLPELSVDAPSADRVVAELAAHRVVLGVAGTSHDVDAGAQRNVARVVGRSGTRGRQEKMVGLTDRSGALEDVLPEEPTLEVFLGAEWSAVVLICRDFIDEGIGSVLDVLRPGLVLVPAMSPRTSDFENQAARIASRQGHVLVANTCSPGDGASVVVLSRPTTEPLETRMIRVTRAEKEPPSAWVSPLAGPQEG